MAYVTTGRFKSALKRHAALDVPQPTLRKGLVAKVGEAGDRIIRFTVSTNAVDLDNDTVDQSGWDLSVFLTNPVVLWSHNAELPPLGKCVKIGVEDDALQAMVEFRPADSPFGGDVAEGVYQMCRTGFLSATSVGFMPLSYEISAERSGEDSWWPAVDFKRQKLLEFSICCIPANSEALIDPTDRLPAAPAPDDPVEAAARAELVRRAAQAREALQTRYSRAKLLARIL